MRERTVKKIFKDLIGALKKNRLHSGDKVPVEDPAKGSNALSGQNLVPGSPGENAGEKDSGDAEVDRKFTSADYVTAFINGAGVGLLLGMLLGLAISPVVSGVIGTLSGLLAVLLGTSEKYMSRLKSIRIGSFGFFCVAGIICGMYIRVNNAILPDRHKMLNDYTLIGFSKEEALDFIAFREFGLVPSEWKAQAGTGETAGKNEKNTADDTAGKQDQHAVPVKPVSPPQKNTQAPQRVFANANETGAERKSVLYSSEVNATDCDLINNADSSQDISEIKNTFVMAGGSWSEFAGNLGAAGFPDKVFVRLLLTVRNWFCESGKKGVIKISYNKQLRNISGKMTLDEINAAITPADTVWFMIKTRLNREIRPEYQKKLYLSLIKTFCHE